MQFVKSLFCLKGADNNDRFLLISLANIVFFLLFTGVVLSSVIAKTIVTVLVIILLFSSAIRRCRDSKSNSYYAWGYAALSILTFTITLSFESLSVYALILLPIAFGTWLFSLPSQGRHTYTIGYFGPVDLSTVVSETSIENKPISSRIEPSLFGETERDIYEDTGLYANTASTVFPDSYQTTHEQTVFEADDQENINGVACRLNAWFIANKILALCCTLLLSLTVIFLSLLPILNSSEAEQAVEQNNDPIEASPKVAITRTNLLEMPDDFFLLLDSNDGLIIHWKADVIRNGEIWSLATGKGDETCSIIEFNKGDKVRTTSVVVENKGSYYANFSPLDAEKVVKLLAKRGNFGLCGYNFSLKGSQKALNINSTYFDLAN